MKLYNTEGIVFRTIKYSETSVICDIYTLEKGLRSFIVSGVRRSGKSAKANVYQPMNLINLTAYDHIDSSKLCRIKEATLQLHYKKINLNVITSAIGMFMIELCRNTIKERESDPSLFEFIKTSFTTLDNETHVNPNFHLVFMTELTRYLGIEPMDNYSNEDNCFDAMEGVFCAKSDGGSYIWDSEDSLIFHTICNYNCRNLGDLKLTKKERDHLIDLCIQYYKIHIPGFKELTTPDILRATL